jgi:hypothetical protein
LLIGAIMCGVAVVPALVISGYVGYYMLVPRYSAVADFDDLGFNLRLDLFLTDDEARDSGRYLTVITSRAYDRYMLQGWDWAHRARTSIYRIDDSRIAVLSALGYDYAVTLKPQAFVPLTSESGEQWRYLGAFDFAFVRNRKPRLQFFGPDSVECIPMGTSDPASWADKPRPQARHVSCPNEGAQ